MKSLINAISVTVVLGMVAMVFYLLYQGSLVIWAEIDRVDHTTKVVLGTISSLVLLLSCLVVFGLRSAALIGARAQLADQRYGLYVHVLTMLRGMLEPNTGLQQRQVLHAELKLTSADFLMLASRPAIKAYLAFEEAMDSGQSELLEPCFQVLWKNLRRDLGFNDDFDVVDARRMIRTFPVGQASESNIPAAV